MGQVGVCHVLGVSVDPLTVKAFYALIGESIETHQPRVIGHHNLHSVYLYHHDPKMKAFYAGADYAFIDGMPLILWGRLMGFPLARRNRFTSVDWLPPLMELCAAKGWRVFYLGGEPNVAETGAQRLRTRFPDLQIKTAHGYFHLSSAQANHQLITEINTWQADLLLVGMGMPRQEHWVLDHRSELQAWCIVPVGAALDYVAGAIPTPPRFMSRLGLEWLARLVAEPRRLWRRYLVEPLSLVRFIGADLRSMLSRRFGHRHPGQRA